MRFGLALKNEEEKIILEKDKNDTQNHPAVNHIGVDYRGILCDYISD